MGKTATLVDPLVVKAAKALRVQPEDVLGAREDDEDGDLYAIVADGRKVCIRGKDVEILTGPGYVDPDAADEDLTADELLAEIFAEHKATKRARRNS